LRAGPNTGRYHPRMEADAGSEAREQAGEDLSATPHSGNGGPSGRNGSRPSVASPARPRLPFPGPLTLRRMWVETSNGRGFFFKARRLWLFSIALHGAGYTSLAKFVKNVNSFVFHNSLPPEAIVDHSVTLGHWGHGIMLHPKVVIGPNVKIFQNVTMAVDPPLSPHQIVIEGNALIGAGAVLKTRRNRGLRIGDGASVGAGAVVTRDVPPDTIAISQPVELRPRGPRRKLEDPD
jgi:serine O-acetyltransferase